MGRKLRDDEEKYLDDLLAASAALTEREKFGLLYSAPDIYWSLSRLQHAQEAHELVQRELQGMRTRKSLGGFLRRNRP